MFGRLQIDMGNTQCLEQIETWVRDRFQLSADMIVLVSELQNSTPGFPEKKRWFCFG